MGRISGMKEVGRVGKDQVEREKKSKGETKMKGREIKKKRKCRNGF